MAKSTSLYLLVICMFAVVYLGTIITHGAEGWPLYFAVAGIILFIVRILRGDD
ncbi:MAG TPA: hypothetical protein VG738_18875 [Chitinophagaceae bacterium]|nr:hypothetical protein [Chitinophagaceae bacterium]